jgi:preprotein translocase subunit YajC
MIGEAFAQAAGAAPAGQPPPWAAFLTMWMPIILIFAVMYFLILRPQQQRQKQTETMLKALKKGDKVLTSSGIYGTVVGLDEHKAVLRIAEDVKVEFAKSAIVQVLKGAD